MTVPELVLARRTLLDALAALGEHRDAVVLVGAQAIYLHTGSVEAAVAEFTTDADLAVDPRLLGGAPLVEDAMMRAGFALDPSGDTPGTWIAANGVQVDLMVPEQLAGKGRRSATVPPHSRTALRRAVGLEAALVDHAPIEVPSLDGDGRAFTIEVAGPAALLVAKLHKVAERVSQPSRLNNKDAHDIYRLLRAVETVPLAASLLLLREDPVSRPVTETAVVYLSDLFAAGADAPGPRLAGAAEAGVGNPEQVALATSLLAADLRNAITTD